MRKVILYGCGKRCERLLKSLSSNSTEYICVDSDSTKWGKSFYGYIIHNPQILSKYQGGICITIGNERGKQEARNIIKFYNNGLLKNEIGYTKLLIITYSEYYKLYDKVGEINNKNSVMFGCHNGLILGGIEEWTKSVCVELVEQGQKDTYIVSPHGKYTVPQILLNKVLYVDIDDKNRLGKKTIYSIIRCIKKHMPCTVITSQIDEILVAANIMKIIYPQYIKVISVIHGGCEENYIGYAELDEFTDLYIGVSRDIQEGLIKEGIEFEKVLHMTCPVKCDEKLVREYTINPQNPIILGYAGRIEVSQKRVDLLMKMIDSLEKKQVNYVLKIAGEGSALKDIYNFIKERKLENKIMCLGKIQRSEIPDFWKAVDVCVNIADLEGRSISIMEAMANGAVPVVTSTSGVREDITDGENGYIVEIGNYNEMADKICELEIHREELKEFGQKSHNLIFNKAQMSTHINFWNEVMNRLWN